MKHFQFILHDKHGNYTDVTKLVNYLLECLEDEIDEIEKDYAAYDNTSQEVAELREYLVSLSRRGRNYDKIVERIKKVEYPKIDAKYPDPPEVTRLETEHSSIHI